MTKKIRFIFIFLTFSHLLAARGMVDTDREYQSVGCGVRSAIADNLRYHGLIWGAIITCGTGGGCYRTVGGVNY